MEATGHYWQNLFAFLAAEGFAIALLNPLRTRRFSEVDLERTKNDRLGKPLGLDGGSPALARAESQRSRTSLSNVANALEGLRRFYLGGDGTEQGFGFDDFLRLGGETSLDGEIQRLLDDSISHARALPPSLSDVIADPAKSAQASQLYSEVTQLTQLIKNDLTQATGVVPGFNENDGD
jgi:predicted lipoprotein